ncbi:MAG: regulatory protein RecX [Dysgonomonas sp.]|nr:regulatory protein RecX [Dysgonomonas sp.]
MKYSESQALSKIAAYCSKAERAEYDVRKKLDNWELNEDEIQNILDRLKKENFINEERYCRSFIKDKIGFNKWGKIKIIFELRKKRIAETTINTCLDEFENNEFEEPLLRLLETKARSIKANNEYEKQAKLTRFALGRGYSLSEIKKCLKTLNYKDDEYF